MVCKAIHVTASIKPLDDATQCISFIDFNTPLPICYLWQLIIRLCSSDAWRLQHEIRTSCVAHIGIGMRATDQLLLLLLYVCVCATVAKHVHHGHCTNSTDGGRVYNSIEPTFHCQSEFLIIPMEIRSDYKWTWANGLCVCVWQMLAPRSCTSD